MRKLLISLLLLSLTSCTGAVILPGLFLFGMQQESENMGPSEGYDVPPVYADFNEADNALRLDQLHNEWNAKYSIVMSRRGMLK